MMPDHLKHLKFDPTGFFRMKNGNWGINDDLVTQLAQQMEVEEQTATIEHMIMTEKKTICSAKAGLVIKGKRWEAVASVSSSEFTSGTFDDRRRHHLAQMAMTRAKNNALSMAMGMTNADVNAIAAHLDIKFDKKGKFQTQTEDPEPDEIIKEPEPIESPEETKKKLDTMREKMRTMKK